jgi:enoyl-CoA hydratase
MNESSSTEFFALSHERGVAHLQLNRPERMNTMTPKFFPAVRDAVRALSDGGETRALVISSTGKHFSAGMALDVFAGDDLALGARTPRERLSFQQSLRKLIDCFTALDEARFPVVCAIQGGCIGGALDLATACDIRVCSADAFFTVQEISIGMAADLGVLQRLPKIVPQGVAREMAYTGDRVGAERALAIGLVNEVLADADAARERGHEARAQPRARPFDGLGARADDAVAERDLRHRRNGDGDRGVEIETGCRIRRTCADRQGVAARARGRLIRWGHRRVDRRARPVSAVPFAGRRWRSAARSCARARRRRRSRRCRRTPPPRERRPRGCSAAAR